MKLGRADENVLPGETKTVEIAFRLPDKLPATSLGNFVKSVFHLNVVAEVSMAKDIELELPLVVCVTHRVDDAAAVALAEATVSLESVDMVQVSKAVAQIEWSRDNPEQSVGTAP